MLPLNFLEHFYGCSDCPFRKECVSIDPFGNYTQHQLNKPCPDFVPEEEVDAFLEKLFIVEEVNGVKVYVPWYFRYYNNGEKKPDRYYDDAFASNDIGEVVYNETLKKYSNTFSSTDFGGYDSCFLTLYFDSVEDILKWNGIYDLLNKRLS